MSDIDVIHEFNKLLKDIGENTNLEILILGKFIEISLPSGKILKTYRTVEGVTNYVEGYKDGVMYG